MRNKSTVSLSIKFGIVLLCCAFLVIFAYYHFKPVERVVFHPTETSGVLNNPFMGFAVDARYDDAVQPYRLAHANLYWKEIEPRQGMYDFKAIEKKYNFELWRSKGVKLVIRVVLDYPRKERHMDIPDWLYTEIGGDGTWYKTDYGQGFSPNYANSILISHHEKLIAALAKRYENDPLIAFIQLGSIGHWGEWHTRNDEQAQIPFPSTAITKQYVEPYTRYFSQKPLLMRRPHTIAKEYGMGLYNDAFGDPEQTMDEFLDWVNHGYTSWLTSELQPSMPDFWKSSPSGGEFLDETLYFEDERIDETLKQARLTHISWVGPNAPYLAPKNGSLQQNIDRFLQTIGYRFIISEESHEKTRLPGQTMHIELKIVNRGVAPFYFDWPLEFSLCSETGEIVAKALSPSDIRSWLPGEHADTVDLKIPPRAPAGKYSFCAAILDPGTGLPGIEWAMDGKLPDGRYRLGQVTVSEP